MKKFEIIIGMAILGLIILLSFTANDLLFSSVSIPFQADEGHHAITDTNYSGVDDTGAKAITGSIMVGVNYIRAIAGIIAIVWIIWSGFSMVTAGGDTDKAKKGRVGMTWALIALSLMLLIEPLVTDSLYGGGKILPGGALRGRDSIALSITEGTKQIMALIEWFKTIVVVMAVLYFATSGWKMIQLFGDQEAIEKQKKMLVWIGVGLVVIALNEVVINQVVYRTILEANGQVVFEQDPVRGIQEFVGLLKFFLKFLAIIAIGILIYGGVLLIMSFTNEEYTERAKKIIIDAGIGFFIILISFALVSTLITGQVG